MSLPTITINEVSAAIQDNATNGEAKKVLEGLLNDYMDLQYGKETPYTTGQQVVPTGATIEDVDGAVSKETDKKFKDVFEKISETEKSGDLTPQATNDGSWDAKFTPVLVLIRPNN
ncbi:Two-component sensor histidine kinase / two-component response regulator [Operophtera brumata]|uniref:Two-component sensor histidine kinase / two-component response regulator n=1 Tax=Operophtera brumata TaxID=104452 RepID=A0A0L7LK84_OPEBR|nr:Two-component sensor histidine kinase / two-component response regulator [Operophtera brumata]